jgi:hypothetical protein
MSGRFFLSGTIPLFEGAAQPLSTLTFSLTGTSTAQDTYSDAGLTAANANPVVSDANGYFGEIFIKRERYKVIWKNASGTTLKTWDPVDKDQVFTRGAGLPSDPHPGQKHANTSDGHTYEYKLATAAWLDLGASDAIANTATVTEQLTGTSTSVYSTPDSVAGLWQRGTDIASAGTLSLPSTGGGVFNITGTTTINGIGSALGGRSVKLKFAGALTLTHNGTSFILPGAANITTVAGDTAEFINEAAQDASGSNWRCVWYQRASGSSLNIDDFDAAQSDQETGTSTTLFVSPGRQQYHKSAAKGWGMYDQSSGTASLSSPSYNVSSITDGATGVATVNWTTAFSTAVYSFVGFARATILNSSNIMSQNTSQSKGASSQPVTNRVCSTDAAADIADASFAAFGDQ